jgi:hypothetical protein
MSHRPSPILANDEPHVPQPITVPLIFITKEKEEQDMSPTILIGSASNPTWLKKFLGKIT